MLPYIKLHWPNLPLLFHHIYKNAIGGFLVKMFFVSAPMTWDPITHNRGVKKNSNIGELDRIESNRTFEIGSMILLLGSDF